MIAVPVWKSFEDLEDNLTLEELNTLISRSRKQKDEELRFHAAIQGADLGDSEGDSVASGNRKDSSFEEVKKRALARADEEKVRAGGVDSETQSLRGLGFDIVTIE